MLLDLGISSPQIDDPARGFSFRADGPLDMRMDPTRGESAAAFLARATARELTEVIRDYGEERFAQSIAGAIVAARAVAPVDGTRRLAAIVAQAVGARPRRDRSQDPATRTFQALRIFINRELAELALTLPRARPGCGTEGRLAVISFHSLEDRIVKRFFASASHPFGGDPRLARLPIAPTALPGAPLAPSAARFVRPTRRGRRQSARAQCDATRRRAHAHPVPAEFRRRCAPPLSANDGPRSTCCCSRCSWPARYRSSLRATRRASSSSSSSASRRTRTTTRPSSASSSSSSRRGRCRSASRRSRASSSGCSCPDAAASSSFARGRR